EPAEVPGARAERQRRGDGEGNAEVPQMTLKGRRMRAEGRRLKTSLFLPFFLLPLTFCLGCSAAPQQKTAPLNEPEIHISQLSSLAEAAAHISGSISVHYRVDILNRANVPITVKRIDVISIGEGAYTLRPTSHPSEKSLRPGETTAVEFWAPAVIGDPTIVGANGPVSVRLTLQHHTPTGHAQSIVIQQVHGLAGLS